MQNENSLKDLLFSLWRLHGLFHFDFFPYFPNI